MTKINTFNPFEKLLAVQTKSGLIPPVDGSIEYPIDNLSPGGTMKAETNTEQRFLLVQNSSGLIPPIPLRKPSDSDDGSIDPDSNFFEPQETKLT